MAEPFLAEIRMFGANFAPRGWALCDGQILPINQNQSLYSLLGTIYGGDGRTSFALPDLRGRVPVHPGNSTVAPPVALGARGGQEAHTMSPAEIPSHTHPATLHAESKPGTTGNPTNNMLGRAGGLTPFAPADPADNKTMHPDAITILPAGAAQAFSIMEPFQCVNYIIAIRGLFPSRS